MFSIDHTASSTEVVIFCIGNMIAVSLLTSLAFYFVLMLFLPFAKIKKYYTDCCHNSKSWTLLAAYVIILFTIFAILFVISTLIRKLIGKRTGVMTRCKCLSIIGYGGVALCGIAPRILVFVFVGNNLYINYHIAFISFVTSFLIYCIILRPNSKHFEIDYFMEGTKSCFWKHAVIHIIVLIVQIRMAIALFEDVKDIATIIGCQLGYSCICVPSIFDFCQVLRRRGAKLKAHNNTIANGNIQNQALIARNNTIVEIDKVDEMPESSFKLECKNFGKINQNRELLSGNEKKVKATKIPEHNFKVECKICMLEYSETRIPRILKECGHTVCEKCANELLKKNNQRHLCCPFCQETTLVKGPANLLPKNYVALEFLDKIK